MFRLSHARCYYVPHKPLSLLTLKFTTTSHHHHDNLLSLSLITQTLNQTKQLHARAIITSILPRSVALSASLILCYATHDDTSSTQVLFHQTLPYSKTAFLRNTLIRANSICGVHDRFRTYNGLMRSGVRPDDHTFPFVLKACADYLEFDKGIETHGFVFKLGFDGDLYVGNTLLQFYGNCGELGSVRKVFDEMSERDAITWNTVIGVFAVSGLCFEALEVFRDMNLSSGVRPNLVSVICALPVCAGLENELMTSQIHSFVMKVGLDAKINTANGLIDAYAKCGNVKASRRVFGEMVERNDVSWNSIITGLAYREYNQDALDEFRKMIFEGLKPNSVALSAMLPVLVELELFHLAEEVHGFCIRTGVEFDIFICNSLIDMYAKSGRPGKASTVFDYMNDKNIVSWNAMVANFAQNRLELEAVCLIRKMHDHGESPNSVTFTNVLPACSRLGSLLPGKEIHARAIRFGLSNELFVSNALTDMYTKCGRLKLARNVFSISRKDEVSYNTLIVGYSQTSDCTESLSLFVEMHRVDMKHDIVSFVGVISACANLAVIKQGKEIHGSVVRRNLHSHLFVANSLLDLYTKCGQIGVARKVFDCIITRDAASWNAMIMGYGMLGDLDIAINLFEAMRDDGVEYDHVSYLAVLTACSHGGFVERGRKFFDQMQRQNIKPTEMHYACIVDLLGRAGLMEEALELIKGLPIEPEANIWGALLGACRVHGNMELGCWAAEHLLRLKPHHCGYYVLLSNMYAEAGRWNEADKVRELMKSRGVKKDPGFSWVQMHDQVHTFVVGEKLGEPNLVTWLAESG